MTTTFFLKGSHTMKQRLLLILVLLFLTIMGCSNRNDKNPNLNSLGYINMEPLPVTEVKFYSESVKRDMAINVVLPRGYDKSELCYPVLYLCHGLTSNYNEFKYVGVPEYLNLFDMIVVMVDVGNSWYVNWAKSENNQQNNFADHVCVDIINYVDTHFRTVAERNGRAINGISMGGFGAISLGLSNPDLFCSVGSLSGALGWAAQCRDHLEKGEKPFVIWEKIAEDTVSRYRDIDLEGYSTIKERTPAGQPFLTVEQADTVDPFKLVLQVPKEQLPHIYLDCGVSDFLFNSAKDFAKLLIENDIAFHYGQSEGTHEEDYWGRELSASIAVQYTVMLRNIWGYEFPRYDAWGR
ncbi:hypothetical protein ISS22_04435 [candidate division KSB1 bacterium]|nr:hypothetical protein [candidate division KSB1 bacterium]